MAPFFVLKNVSGFGQTRYAALPYRNNRPRVMAFESVHDAKTALASAKSPDVGVATALDRRDRPWSSSSSSAAAAAAVWPSSDRDSVCIFKTSGSQLAESFGRAEIGVDFCTVDEGTGGLAITRSVVLRTPSSPRTPSARRRRQAGGGDPRLVTGRTYEQDLARCTLERDFGIDYGGHGCDCPRLEL